MSTSSTDSIQLNQPTWLLIDTTGQGCHIGLTHQGVCWTDSDMQPQSHTKRVLPMIESLLTQAKLSMNEVQGIVYTKGPGSFTGVRVGVSVVQGLAFASSIPTLGVSTLMALAWQGYCQTQQSNVGAIIDARMAQIYWAVYDFTQDAHVMRVDCISSVEQVSEQPMPRLVAGDVHLLEKALVKGEIPSFSAQPNVDIKSLFSLVETGLKQQFLSWDEGLALPIYLRNDVAHLPKK
ncbi:MAG: tRNA (adenosine(37)-N6)-threonylcarbamoyltransferase complex dimerization subunit type 1 TsaB [Gammaproteobacteria bacterium]|nr:tRNA (adenosine(37)-N6)-threonylcarbamoyltransferase complex dimerization subunit type 1 TsaB [Gammaproteobacteria bacterium]